MKNKNILFSAFLICSITFFLSCSHQNRNSLAAEFDRIDSYIMIGQYRDAVLALRRIEKSLANSWDYIGVYRRYSELGESERAVETIQNAFKKYSENPEIRTLYVHNLLREGFFDDAAKNAAPLKGTRYGSLYAEALLKQVLAEFNTVTDKKDNSAFDAGDEELLPNFLSPDFFPIYYDAYIGSRNSYWLRNAAIVGMVDGNIEQVRALRPERYASFADAYFWALVHYDNGNYGDAENSLTQARSLYEVAPRRERVRVSDTDFVAMLSDVYQALSENDRAETVRQNLLSTLQESDYGKEDALAYIYINSAEWAAGNGKDDRASELLTQAAAKWPDFIPGLISYANFAYRTTQERIENVTQLALRESGVATREMQRYDNRAQIPVADAIAKMESSLERNRNPLLYIARLDLLYKIDKTLSADSKISDLWNVLERNMIGVNKYPQLLLEYAVNMLIRYGREEDAFDLFTRHCSTKYSFDPTIEFWNQLYENIEKLSESEIEYAGWFAAKKNMGTTAQNFYEVCVWQDRAAEKQIYPNASVQACMNLAMIYSSTGDTTAALELYSASAGRTPDVSQKAEIMYRMALIYEADGNISDALRTVASSCSLDPSHAKAQFLYSRLSAR